MTLTRNKRHRLEQRSVLLQQVRKFFETRRFIEVETPLVSAEVIPELHIEPRLVDSNQSVGPAARQTMFLQASPELHMKRLLCEGFEKIYQITRSFRGNERGRLHSPEFTIVEWYRTGDAMKAGITLLDDFCQDVAGARPAIHTSYAEAFERYVGVDPHQARCEVLEHRARELGVNVPTEFPRDDRDEWLNLLLSFCIEPQLGAKAPQILYDYPDTQASLAKLETSKDGQCVAKRFELYWRGIELANGYEELTDAAELRQRFIQVNEQRASTDRPTLPLPESLLTAMTSPGLPQSSGCALGFDRLAMLVAGADSIAEISVQ